MDAEKLRDVQYLVSLFCDGVLDQAGVDQLSQLLTDDPEAVEAYLDLTTTHSDLTLLGTTGPAEHRGGGCLGVDVSTSDVPGITSEGLTEPFSGGGHAAVSWWQLGLAVLATSLMIFVAYIGLVQQNQAVDAPRIVSSGTNVAEDTSVAKIIRKIDCDWENDRWAIVSSSSVQSGQTLSLSRGLMELEFKSGAMITLEAPVTFSAQSAMRGVLSHGKLTAKIPESAHGFTVSTPGGEAIDLGTNFGLYVGENGVTETHVFEGEVVVRPAGSDDQKLHLTDDMALRTGGDQAQPNSLVAVPARFMRFDFKEGKSLPVPVVDRQLSLWLSADQRLQKDENDGVSSWGDLCTKSNKIAQDAWQVKEAMRPKWIEDAIGGRPAVRFGIKNVLVTEPIKLGSAQSICATFSINEALLKKTGIGEIGRQLLNMNGPPHMILGIDDQFKLVSRNYAGLRPGKVGPKGHRTLGLMKTPNKLDEKPVVVISVYDSATNQSRLYLNGELVAKNTAPEVDSTESPRYIGAHSILPLSHFFGDVAELMIYDTGLTNGEAVLLSKSMMKKYQITAAEVAVKNEPGDEKVDSEEVSKSTETTEF